MAPQGDSLVTGVEIERVRPVVEMLFDYDKIFLGAILKRPVEVVSNRDMRLPLGLRPGGKFGLYNPDGGSLGRGSGITYDKALINCVHFKHAVEWTELTELATDDKRKAVLNNFKDALAKGLDEFRRQLDSMCMTDGTGVIATVSTYAVGGGLGGGDKLTLASDGFGARLPRYGQSVNIFNAALSLNRTSGAEREINFHDLAAKIIDITPSVATGIATDKVVISGVTSAPPVALLGVPYHNSNASTGTWLGFNRALTPEIRANRVAAGGPLALPFARLAVNKIADRVGLQNGMKCDAWMHRCQTAAYEELGQLVTMINKMPDGGKLNLYYGDDMQLAGCPVKVSMSWDKTRIDFITDHWGRAEMAPIDFFTKNGQKVFEVRASDGGVVASSICYPTAHFNLFLDNPAGSAYIDTLTVPAGY